MDIITRLMNCLKSQENSATEVEKAIRSAIKHITELREALELVDDLGSFSNLLETDEGKHCETITAELTDEEKIKFEKWVIENIHDDMTPADSTEALVYNLVHLIKGDKRLYNYEEDQEKEVNEWLGKLF